MSFRKELKKMCAERKITLADLALKLKLSSSALSVLGTKKGISFHMFKKVVKKLKLTDEQEILLARLALFTSPQKIIAIDDELYDLIISLATRDCENGTYFTRIMAQSMRICGAKTNIKTKGLFE